MAEQMSIEPSGSNSVVQFFEKYRTLSSLSLIVAVGLAIRLAVLPFATADGGDATYRVWIAWSWISNPTFMPSEVWGPLHFYLMGPVIWLFSDTVVAPVMLHVVFGVVAPLLMYAFVRIEFSNLRIALLVALTFAVYPILVRNSVSVRAEAPFVVLLLCAMIFLSLARKATGTWHHALIAGAFLTLAGMLRYEAWMLIPLFALVLWSKWRFATIFVSASMVFPIIWMVACTVEYGHPLHSMMWSSTWELNYMGRSEKGFGELLRQGVGYLLKLASGLTLLIALASVAGALILLVKRHRSAVWILPLCGLALLMEIAILRGSLVPKSVYTVTLGTMLIPLSAAFYEGVGIGRLPNSKFAAITALMVGSVILFSCEACWGRFVHQRLLGVSPIPRIENQEIALQIPDVIESHLNTRDEGFISDFYGWGATPHVALLTRLPSHQILRANAAPNRPADEARISRFLDDYPNGVLLILRESRFAKTLDFSGNEALVNGKTMRLEKVASFSWPKHAKQAAKDSGDDESPQKLELFRYQVVSKM
jgi:hypothetical protein